MKIQSIVNKKTAVLLLVTLFSFLSGWNNLTHAETVVTTLLGQYSAIGENELCVKIVGNYAYLGGTKGLTVLDVSNPANPIKKGTDVMTKPVSDIFLQGNYAYVTSGDGAGSIFAIDNIANPSVVTRVGTKSYLEVTGVFVNGNYAYLAACSSGLKILDISNPASPTEVGSLSVAGELAVAVAVSGSYVYLADAGAANCLRIIDVSVPASPVQKGTCSMSGSGPEDVAVRGNYAYVAADEGGLRIVNIGNPVAPYEVGSVTTNYVSRVCLNGDYIYASTHTAGMRIINISNPTLPIDVGEYRGYLKTECAAVDGMHAYIADHDAGLLCLNYFQATPTPTATITATVTPTMTVTPIAPMVASLIPTHRLIGSQVDLAVWGKYLAGVDAIKLRSSNQTITGSGLDVSGSSITAHFDFSNIPGLFDLVLNRGAFEFVYKTVFTLLAPPVGTVQWQVQDLGNAGNPSALNSANIVVVDADRDDQAEVYVADNDRMVFKYKKTTNWTTSYLLETPGQNFQQVIATDGNGDHNWELYIMSAQPQIYQCMMQNGNWQNSVVGSYGGLLAVGDGNRDGANEIYAVMGNTTASQGIAQYSYNGSTWASSTVEAAQSIYSFTSLLVGDGDNDHADEVYAANQDHYIYQFKYNGTGWARSVVANLGSGKTKSMVLGDLDRDGANELYSSNEDGKIYQLKWSGSAWSSAAVNAIGIVFNQIAVGDADNDGVDELYGAGQDGHVYRFKTNNGLWQTTDLGGTTVPLVALAVGDGDNNYQSEIYTLGNNAHLYQVLLRIPFVPTPTVTAVMPIAYSDKRLKVLNSKINPLKGEQARIRWYQSTDAGVNLVIYNMVGDKITTLAENKSFVSDQLHEITWDGKTSGGAVVGSGIYIVYLQSGDYKTYSKIAVVK